MRTRHLSPRETQVASLISEGFQDREVAERLGIATSTVHVHRDHVYRKLGVRNRTELARWWFNRMTNSVAGGLSDE